MFRLRFVQGCYSLGRTEIDLRRARRDCQRFPELWMPTVIIAVTFSLTDLYTSIIWNIWLVMFPDSG